MPFLPPRALRDGDEAVALVEREDSQELASQIANLDEFFQHVYDYFYARGYVCLLVERTLRILRTGFVIAFTAFLVLFIDWGSALSCHQEQCEQARLVRPHLGELRGWQRGALVVEGAFCLYLVVLVGRFLGGIRASGPVRHVYRLMALDDTSLQIAQWGEVTDRLVALQSRVLLSRVGRVDHLNVAMRLMRIDNFMVALFSLEVLDLSLCGLPLHLTRSLEWNLRYLLNLALTSLDPQRPVAGRDWDAAALRSKILWLGVTNVLAAPFVLCHLVIVGLFAHGAEIKMSPSKVSVRHWSREALWRLREYNELPHQFEKRLQVASPLAQAYIDQFPYRVVPLVARFTVFVTGGFACAILLLSLLNYPLLLFIEVRGQNLLWWLSVFTLLIVAGLQFSDDDRHGPYNAQGAFDALLAQSHYQSLHWRDPKHPSVRDAVAGLYQYRWSIAFQEVASILMTPLALLLVLPPQADRLLRFIRDHTVVLDAAGPVCAFSAFPADGLPTLHPAQRAKVAWSFRGFRDAYPNWPSGGREAFLTEAEEFEMVSVADPPVDG